jgi:hypothetical protein
VFDFAGMTKLLVASGIGADLQNLASVEIVNLDESNPDLICDNLPDLPVAVYAATGQLFNQKHPIICGGYNDTRYHCECHSFRDGAWHYIPSLNDCRGYSTSAVFSNPNSNAADDEILYISGGKGEAVLSTVESFDGNKWNETMFDDLPTTIMEHCLVKINDTMLMQISGSVSVLFEDTTDRTYFFDIIQNKWTSGPDLNYGRVYHSCGVMNWMNPNTGMEEKVSNWQLKNI